MNNHRRTAPSFSAFLMLIGGNTAVSQQLLPSVRPSANVAGHWTIDSWSDDGKTATKYVHLQQNGSRIAGHFKGPYQSGSLVGSIDAGHIVFRTRTREVLTFRGMVHGDSIQGTFGICGMHGVWQAMRTN